MFFVCVRGAASGATRPGGREPQNMPAKRRLTIAGASCQQTPTSASLGVEQAVREAGICKDGNFSPREVSYIYICICLGCAFFDYSVSCVFVSFVFHMFP